MRIDLLSTDARAKSAARILALDRRHTVRSGVLFSGQDTPPDILTLPIPVTRDGQTLTDTPYTLEDCQKALLRAAKKTTVLGYGPCPAPLIAPEYRDLSKDEIFVSANAELTAEGGMMLLYQALSAQGLSLYGTLAVILGYGRIARAMAARLSVSGAEILIGARRHEAREAARKEGYLSYDCTDPRFFSERGRFLFADRTHVLINTVPSPDVIAPTSLIPHPFCALELSGKSDVLSACQSLPYPTLDGKSIPTRFFPESAGALLAQAILRYCHR